MREKLSSPDDQTLHCPRPRFRDTKRLGAARATSAAAAGVVGDAARLLAGRGGGDFTRFLAAAPNSARPPPINAAATPLAFAHAPPALTFLDSQRRAADRAAPPSPPSSTRFLAAAWSDEAVHAAAWQSRMSLLQSGVRAEPPPVPPARVRLLEEPRSTARRAPAAPAFPLPLVALAASRSTETGMHPASSHLVAARKADVKHVAAAAAARHEDAAAAAAREAAARRLPLAACRALVRGAAPPPPSSTTTVMPAVAAANAPPLPSAMPVQPVALAPAPSTALPATMLAAAAAAAAASGGEAAVAAPPEAAAAPAPPPSAAADGAGAARRRSRSGSRAPTPPRRAPGELTPSIAAYDGVWANATPLRPRARLAAAAASARAPPPPPAGPFVPELSPRVLAEALNLRQLRSPGSSRALVAGAALLRALFDEPAAAARATPSPGGRTATAASVDDEDVAAGLAALDAGATSPSVLFLSTDRTTPRSTRRA